MQYLAVCANWDNDVRGRISEWDIGGVVVVMGDSRRHKDIGHASPNGGWVVDYRCFPTKREKKSGAGDYYPRQSRATGGSCSRQRHSRELASLC